MTLKVNQGNMLVMYHFGHKFLCDGYVIKWRFSFDASFENKNLI